MIEFVCVEVGQIGDGNLRVVIHNYRLEPTLDLEDLLTRPGVRDALQACATAPDDEGLRRAAVAELLRGPADGTDFVPPEAPTPEFSGGRSDYEWEAEFGLVILHDCRGIQIGDRNRQYATFAHVVAPDVDVAGLVRSDARLARAVVDTVCGLEAAGDLQNRLVEAVVVGAESAYGEGPPGGGLHPWQSLTAVGERNISVGDGNVEQSHVLIDWDGADPLVEPFVGLHARLAREAEEAAKAADVEATVDWVDGLPTPGPDDLRACRPNIDYEADTRTSRPEAEPHFDTSYETGSIRPDTRWSGPPGPGL